MAQSSNPQSLDFNQVKYSIEQIKHWLNNFNVDVFVFYNHFSSIGNPNPAMQLCCYVLNSSGYLNPNNPDILESTSGDVLEMDCVNLTANLVNGAEMSAYLQQHPDCNYLLFTPSMFDNCQVMYTIQAVIISDTQTTPANGFLNTNPSPPATAMIDVEML